MWRSTAASMPAATASPRPCSTRPPIEVGGVRERPSRWRKPAHHDASPCSRSPFCARHPGLSTWLCTHSVDKSVRWKATWPLCETARLSLREPPMKKNDGEQDLPAEPLERARLQADVAKQRVRIAKEELKRARKRLKEAKREARRARKQSIAARKVWKRARRAQKDKP